MPVTTTESIIVFLKVSFCSTLPSRVNIKRILKIPNSVKFYLSATTSKNGGMRMAHRRGPGHDLWKVADLSAELLFAQISGIIK